jgi:hypothetical protein
MLLVIVYRIFISRKYFLCAVFFCGFTHLLLNKYWKYQFYAYISCSSCNVYSCIHLLAETLYQVSIIPYCSLFVLQMSSWPCNNGLQRFKYDRSECPDTFVNDKYSKPNWPGLFHGLCSSLVSVFSSVMKEHNPLPVLIFLVNLYHMISARLLPLIILAIFRYYIETLTYSTSLWF